MEIAIFLISILLSLGIIILIGSLLSGSKNLSSGFKNFKEVVKDPTSEFLLIYLIFMGTVLSGLFMVTFVIINNLFWELPYLLF